MMAQIAEIAPGLNKTRVPTAVYPSTAEKPSARRHTLLFFIPGNPGLIAYYRLFLQYLRQRCDEIEASHPNAALHIYGQNLIGFDGADHTVFGTSPGQRPPFTLEEQINHFLERLAEAEVTVSGSSRPPDQIILIGHSVGAYIAIEAFDRLTRQQPPHPAAHRVRAAVPLFPAVAHLARSQRGKRLDWLRTVPVLDRYAHVVAQGFVNLWPPAALRVFVGRVMGFAPHAVDATVGFLRGRDAIWQALHLGKDELRTITQDRWAEDLWEIGDAAQAARDDVPKFFFYFGENDHWLADEFREEFIRRREEHAARDVPKHKKARTRIVIDEHKTPHDFCIHHSELVAEKVSIWIDEVMASD